MKFAAAALTALSATVSAATIRRANNKRELDGHCNVDGTSMYPEYGRDNSERLLLREGVIDEIPRSLCGREGKNVILVIGDGMGWEMNRAGAIAKRVVHELESLGCDTKVGCPDNEHAMMTFHDRVLSDYYMEGKFHSATMKTNSCRLICSFSTRFYTLFCSSRTWIWAFVPRAPRSYSCYHFCTSYRRSN